MAKLSVPFVLLLGFLLPGCGADACNDKLISEVSSPDGAARALPFQRDCGATTGFSTQISIVGPGRLSGGGNAFVADDDHGAAAAAPWGGPWAEMRWTSPTHLLIRYDEKARVFKSEGRVGTVSVSFEKEAPPSSR